jgi:hypothetical protein
MHRINRLEWAEKLDSRPSMIPVSRPRGIKAFGTRYEKLIAKSLGSQAERGIWWKFKDANGVGYCQTDFVIIGNLWVAILESKHTWTIEGMEQLKALYIPVLRCYYDDRSVIGIQICKHLTPYATGGIYSDIHEAISTAKRSNKVVTFHWRGLAPILERELVNG